MPTVDKFVWAVPLKYGADGFAGLFSALALMGIVFYDMNFLNKFLWLFCTVPIAAAWPMIYIWNDDNKRWRQGLYYASTFSFQFAAIFYFMVIYIIYQLITMLNMVLRIDDLANNENFRMLPGMLQSYVINSFEDADGAADANAASVREGIEQLKFILWLIITIIMTIWMIHGYFLVVVFSYYKSWPNGK